MNCGLAVYTLISDVGLQGGASYFLLCWHLGVGGVGGLECIILCMSQCFASSLR